MTKKKFILYTIILAFIVLFFISCILALEVFIFMLLWNWITPLFWSGFPILTFWQAFGIMVLINIIGTLLFKHNYARTN